MANIGFEKLELPELLVGNSRRVRFPPYDILNYGPYQVGKLSNKIRIIPYIKTDINLQNLLNDLFDLSKLGKKEYPFEQKRINKFEQLVENYKGFTIEYPETTKDKLYDLLSLSRDTLYIIIHEDRLSRSEYHKTKLFAILQDSTVQFINLKHLIVPNSYTTFNIWIQLLAKSGGKPWIVDNSTNSFKRNTLLIGISFSHLNNKVMYGVSHFVDLNNLDQSLELTKLTRKDGFTGIMLKEDEMSAIIEKGISWFKGKNEKAGDISIYIYKTSPLHKDEINSISKLIQNKDKYGFTKISVSHTHVKSKNFGVPRFYDPENLESDFKFMAKMGTCLQIQAGFSNNETFPYQTELVIATTGYIPGKKGRGTLGTPKPLFLHVHATEGDMIDYVKKQTMAMKVMDWENSNIQNSKLFILKYSQRMARLLSYVDNIDEVLPNTLDVRQLM
ncbi:MAG: hypothetical protein ACP5IB_08830 [Thermoplasmata archaeon]|jgi:hypothetical protein